MAVLLPFGLLCLLAVILAWIDVRDGIIPDWMNLAIAGLGLANAVMIGGWAAGIESVGEGVAIGAVFWLLRRLYFTLRKVQGLGLGDVKFLAAAGVWVGIAGLPMLLLIATLAALACAGIMQFAGRSFTARSAMPFGPFLALGLVFAYGFQQIWISAALVP